MKNFYIILVALFLANGSMAQWFPQNSGTTNDLYSVYFTDSITGYAVGEGGTIIKTTNGGTLWTSQNSGTIKNLYSVCFTSSDTGYAAGDDGTIIVTTNGGTNWIPQISNTSIKISAIDFPIENTGYAVGGDIDGAKILKTIDGGSNWIIAHYDTSMIPNSVVFSNADTGYTGGNTLNWIPNGVVMKTINGGIDWAVCGGCGGWDGCGLHSIYFTDVNIGYFGFSSNNIGYISKTTDGGVNWTSDSCGIWPTSIFFPTDDIGFISGEDYIFAHGAIRKTNNGGINWTGNPYETSNSLKSLYFTSTEIGYVVGSNGTVLKTVNGGYVGLTGHCQTTENLTIYPNPTPNTITIETPELSQKSYLTIYNLNGQELLKQTISEPQTIIDISNLNTGLYIVKVIGERSVRVGKIIKE